MAKNKIPKRKIGEKKSPNEEDSNQKVPENWWQRSKEHVGTIALITAFVLFFITLTKTDQTYTNLTVAMHSMLLLSCVAALLFYVGKFKSLARVAVLGVAFYMVPVYFQTTTQQIVKEAVSFIKPIPPPAPTASITPASGRTFTIALKPNEKYEVDKVRQGQRWSFPAFTGQFQSRVDTGDDSACWETVENTLPWKAEKSGTLQIRTGQADVKVTVNVQS